MTDTNTLMREMIEAFQKDFLKDCDIYFKGKNMTKNAKKILFVLNNIKKKLHNWCRTKFDKYETNLS
ncbi:uncharacterized protein PHACADRAFT_191291 [Phanerochaete carnosa HHB-10118-sp]|uniref:Uncharacterized protein n=1 Tax=Phanerochaete carnosa (strain HHB-10118-sp) TaxID=650164 RepID=K5W514_PHACS|nr:uncharacterized protein PHACADRAFT_191291 [Phanerochaete carnosa HHB-10118-sp]EKM58988.1 hypothetical protein PHACADRAFT_191291 [Phanerochaete carnosa HHB-10118-sp]